MAGSIFKNEKKIITDDPLQFLLNCLLYHYLKYNYYIKTSGVAIVIYIEAFNVLCFVDAFMNSNWELLKQYLPMIILQQPGALGMALGLTSIKEFFSFREVIFQYCWSINSAGADTQNKIEMDCESVKSFSVMITLMALFVHASFLPLIGDEKDIMYAIMIIEKYLGKWSNFLCSIYYFCMLIFSYGSILLVFICLYIIFHLKFQFYLINEHLQTLSDDFDLEDEIRFDDNYQENVYKRIVLCTNHHVNIKLMAHSFSNITRLPLAVLTLVSSMVFVASAFFIMSRVSPVSNFRMLFACLACSTILGALCTCGEMLAEDSNTMYYLCTTSPWILWNKQNRQALSIFMMGCSQPIKITFYSLLDLNYSFILCILRITYKLQALFLKYKMK